LLNPVWLISWIVSLSSSFSLAVWFFETLTLTLLNPTQKHMIYGSKASSYHPKHESVTGIHMHWLKQCRSWVFFRGFRTVLVQFLVQIFFLYVFICWFVGLQRWINVVNLGILKKNSEKVRVYGSEPKLHGFALFYIVLELVVVFERNKGVSLWFYLALSGTLIWFFGNPWIDSVLCWFSLKSGNKLVIASSPSWTVRNPWILRFSSSSLLWMRFHRDRARSLPSTAANSHLNCGGKRFGDDDSVWITENFANFVASVLNFNSGKTVRVWMFLNFFWICEFWSNWKEREISLLFVMMWLLNLMILTLILTLYPIYKLPCVYLIQWACDMWTWTACVALVDETVKNELKDQYAINETKGTGMQLKIWTVLSKRENWTDLKIKKVFGLFRK